MLVSLRESPDAATHQVDEEANVVANSNAVNCTAVCNDLFSVSGFWKGIESMQTVSHTEAQL